MAFLFKYALSNKYHINEANNADNKNHVKKNRLLIGGYIKKTIIVVTALNSTPNKIAP